jgi:1,4-dihydroxy-2-naphthoate octaprenyltransferase
MTQGVGQPLAGLPSASAPRSAARVWWQASRPATLAASVAPVLAGTAVAVHEGSPRLLPGLGALLVAVAMQVGVNYANDYSDFVRGADRRRMGPLRAASSGVVAPKRVRAAGIAAFALAALGGLAVSLVTDWRLVILGALAVAAGWLYTGGPRPYGYLGLGELFVFVFFGLFATVGTAYVELQRVPALAWPAGIATGCLACAILVLNNLRDIATDREAGKRTLAVRLGRSRTRLLLAVLLAVPYGMPVLAFALGYAGAAVLLPLLTVGGAVGVFRASASHQPALLVGTLKRCAQLELWFALAWAVGLVL